jgi:hypothetical protein
MYPQINNLLSTNFGIFRNLGTLTVAGYQEVMAKQLESSEVLFSRNCQKLKAGLAQTASVTTPDEWLQAMRSIAQSTIESASDDMRTALDCQRETNRVIEKQAAEAQQAVSELLKGVVANSDKLASGKQSVDKLAA